MCIRDSLWARSEPQVVSGCAPSPRRVEGERTRGFAFSRGVWGLGKDVWRAGDSAVRRIERLDLAEGE